MRLLLLHTDGAMLKFLPGLLPERAPELEVRNGNQLDQAAVVSLLKEQYGCIIVNLRLPAMLSIRIAELIHLARMPTRLVLLSGAPQQLASGLPLYDNCVRIPFYDKRVLEECLDRPLLDHHRALRSQEHLDIAILNFLQGCDGLAPGCRGALHAFGMYRDAYLHRPWPDAQTELAFNRARNNEQIDFFAEVSPLGFAERLNRIGARVNASPRYTPSQKSFLSSQFSHLLDAFGLTLMNFRNESKAVLDGLEQFGSIAETGGSDADSTALRESLLRSSAPMRYVHQGIIQIVRFLPVAV
jgi:hypothetical protein